MVEEQRGLIDLIRKKLSNQYSSRQIIWMGGVVAVLLVTAVFLGVQWASGESTQVLTRSSIPTQAESSSATERDEGSTESSEQDDTIRQSTPVKQVVVDVSGAVASPQVITLPEGSRVQDALDAAGGLLAEADLSSINRAALVQDGQKISVPRIGEASISSDVSSGASGSSTQASRSERININTADVAQLDELPGVGPSTAEAIVKEREDHGPFESVDDLMRVSGIGEKKLEKLADSACV